MKQRFLLIISIICVGLIIFDPYTAKQSADSAIGLCLQSVIPSLFPFIFLTTLISSNCDLIRIPPLRFLGKLTSVPLGCESILLLGWLGGYPIGAKCIYENYKSGQLSKQTASRMLGFCNNAGPSFIFGVLFCLFTNPALLWLLWGIQILSSILTGLLLPQKAATATGKTAAQQTSLTQALQSSVQTIGVICGWILLFRIAFGFLHKWFADMIPETTFILITGLLELTNGCFALQIIPNEAIRFLLCNSMLTFGGLCVGLQTRSVVKELGFGMYFPGKLLQCCISITLSFIALWLFF